jgi:hypothetical protein
VKLFKRFPTLRSLPQQMQHIIDPAKREDYPAFAEDFETLEKELMPAFREFDTIARYRQNWYRWMYMILVFGGALTTVLIILQIAFLSFSGFDIAGAIVAGALGATTALSRAFNHHERYLNARLAAERLRSEYFLFLGYLDQYSDSKRIQRLRDRVAEIHQGGSV